MAPAQSTFGRAFGARRRVESLEMRTLLLAAVVLAGVLPDQGAQPINPMCPVKPRQKSRPNITVMVDGQLIGFC